MSQFIWQNYRAVRAEFKLIKRTGTLPKFDSGRIRAELQGLGEALSKFADHRETLLKTLPLTPAFLDALQTVSIKFDVADTDIIDATIEGPWWVMTLCETFIMSILQEIHLEEVMKNSGYAEDALYEKIYLLNCTPEVKIVEFGTRRRASKQWQHEVVSKLLSECPENLVGTSNVALGVELDLPVRGTMAHEIFMGVAALFDHSSMSLRGSQQVVLKQWYDMYGKQSGVALTDTWGCKAFFADWTEEQARGWGGYRHDSGSIEAFILAAYNFHLHHGVGKVGKELVFSNALKVRDILKADELSRERGFFPVMGWGTNLTCDVGMPGLDIVVKLTSVNGRPTVKLSDDIGKTLGPEKKVAFYRDTFNQY